MVEWEGCGNSVEAGDVFRELSGPFSLKKVADFGLLGTIVLLCPVFAMDGACELNCVGKAVDCKVAAVFIVCCFFFS